MAEITDWDADIIFVEEPSLGARLTFSIEPDGTSRVGSSNGTLFFALSVDYIVSFVAFFADSFLLIELLASSLNFTTNSVFIEVVSIGAFDAGVFEPDFAAKVIIELSQESGVTQLLRSKFHGLSCDASYE